MNSKGRPLHLLKYLYDYTDEEHPISTADLMAFYEQNGFTTNRNTIRDDIASLNEAGFEVVTERHDSNMHYMAARPFEKVEVRMLIDAVSSAQFICESRTHALVEKLAKLSDAYADFPYTIPTHKTDNAQMYYYVNEIEVAIREKKKLAFRYYEYLPNKQKVFRHNGAQYSVSPYALLWKDDRYYMLGWNDARDAVNTFRIDLMADVSATTEDAHERPEDFSPDHYGKSVIMMYDGRECDVVLLCENKLMTKMFDKFGSDFDAWRVDDDHFRAKVHTNVSKTFYGWLFQYVGEIDVLGPADVVEEYRSRLSQALERVSKRSGEKHV